MKHQKVMVAGGGVLGSQIAFQSAYSGFEVVIWAHSDHSAEIAKQKLSELKKIYTDAINKMAKDKSAWCAGIADEKKFDKDVCLNNAKKASDNIKIEIDLKAAVVDADIVIEAISELKDVKIDFYKKLAPLLKEDTVVVTNSSTLLPSTFAPFTGRPEKYLALHFANSIWKNNTAEVMMHASTSKEAFDKIIKFAKDIRMFPLPIEKEKSGYLLNSMLVPLLLSGLDLYVNGIAEPKNIDAAWTRGTGAPNGPFEIMDIVGLPTAYNIVEQYQKVPGLLSPLLKKMMMSYNFKGMKEVLSKYIADGKTGKQAGEGFYKY